MKNIAIGFAFGVSAGAALTIYLAPRMPAVLWWLFSQGDT